jgi:hypothetical protein
MAHGVTTSRCGVATVPRRGGRVLSVARLLRTGSRRSARALPGRPGGVLTTAAARRDTPSPIPVADEAAAPSAVSSSGGACRPADPARYAFVRTGQWTRNPYMASPSSVQGQNEAACPQPGGCSVSAAEMEDIPQEHGAYQVGRIGAGTGIVDAAKRQLIELNEMAMYSKPAVEAAPRKVRLAGYGRPA